MQTYLLKLTFLIALFCLTIKAGNAQSDQSEADRHSFNFKAANASLLASNFTMKSNFSLQSPSSTNSKKDGKMSKSKKLRIVGAVLTTLGAAALAGTIYGSVVYGRKAFSRNIYSDELNTGDVLRFSGVLVGGTLASNALIGSGIWMIADNME